MLSCLWDGAYKRTLAVNRRIAYVAAGVFLSHYHKNVFSASLNKFLIIIDKNVFSASLNTLKNVFSALLNN